MARPRAEDLAHRCTGLNGRGEQCGSPAVHGSALCRAHLVGRANRRKLERVGDRMVALTALALDRLEEILNSGTDELAERAARVILDRTLPKPSATQAISINLPGVHDPTDPGTHRPPSEIIAQRLAELAPAAEDVLTHPAEDADILDAELVEP